MILSIFKKMTISIILSLFVNVSFAQNEKDSTVNFYYITLKDGSSVIGRVVEEGNNSVVLKDKNIGQVTILFKNTLKIEKLIVGNLFLFELQDGSKYTGKLIAFKDEQFIIETNSIGNITVEIEKVLSFKVVQEGMLKDGKYWFPNPNATRYFFAPSAIPLKKGEGYYQNAYILANSANVGLTENISIGGGILLPFLIYITPKVAFKVSENFYAGGGILYANSLLKIDSDGFGAGIAYGLTTYGNEEHNITLGAGYGFVRSGAEYDFADRPILTVNGMTRIGKRIALVTENWIVPIKNYKTYYDPILMAEIQSDRAYYNYETAFSYGFRIMSEKSTFDLGFINNKEISSVFYLGIPYIDYVFKF